MTTTTTTAQPTQTREGWLLAGAELLWPRIVAAGGTRPERCRVSCGWPSSSPLMRASSARRTLGEAWHGGSDDGAREVFISPVLHKPVEVLDVLAHELVHAACAPGVGHGPVFAAICKKIGLTEGKPTQARAGERMLEELAEMAKGLGPYPHSKLDRLPGTKQKARMMKVSCPACGCVLRMTRTWIDTYLPTCGCGSAMVSEEHEVEGEPLTLKTSHVEYTTQDGRFHLATTKTGRVEGSWTVTMMADEDGAPLLGDDVRWTIRHSREDALAFIAAVRDGEAAFPESWEDDAEDWGEEDEAFTELDDLDLGDDLELAPGEGDEYLADDEPEELDNPEDAPEDVEEYEATIAYREESGRRKSLAIIAAGGEGAMD